MADFIVTDKVACEVVLNILVNQRMNESEINIDIDNLFQKLGGHLSKEQIERVLDQLGNKDRELEDGKETNQ